MGAPTGQAHPMPARGVGITRHAAALPAHTPRNEGAAPYGRLLPPGLPLAPGTTRATRTPRLGGATLDTRATRTMLPHQEQIVRNNTRAE